VREAEPTREELRAIPLDTLRAFVLAEVERSSVRALAKKAGIRRTTLRNFISGTMPHARVRRLLALWYVRESGGADADACEALLAALPSDRRADALASLQSFLVDWRRTYGRGGG
jgi:hypothetical protein